MYMTIQTPVPSWLQRLGLWLQNPALRWTVAVWWVATLVALPVLVVLGSIFADAGEIWSHLAATVLQQYITNSLTLMVGVGMGVCLIGISTAWLVSMCRFPGRRWFEWALLLPPCGSCLPVGLYLYGLAGLLRSDSIWAPSFLWLGAGDGLLVP